MSPRLILLALFVCLLHPCRLIAGETFPPVGPEVWSVSDAATQGQGALYLDLQVRVHPRFVEFQERIRITSDAGKSAVDLPTFSSSCYEIQGRTIHPDGRLTPFTGKDLVKKTLVRNGASGVDRQVVAVPGVSGDCVVDLRWKESTPFDDPNHYGFGALRRFSLSGPYPVQRAVVGIARNLAWSWGFRTGRAVLVKKEEKAGMTWITLADVPAEPSAPYSLRSARITTELTVYPVPEALYGDSKRGPEAYWKAVGLLLRDYFEKGIRRGRAYAAFATPLLKDLPSSAVDRAAALMSRLDGAIRNLTFPTHEEEARMSRKEAEAEIDSKDLDGAAERGSTDAAGMGFLFRALLKDAGLTPVLALVEDRNVGMFDAQLSCYQQFDNVLTAVRDESGTLNWFAPGRRFFRPGLIPEAYQGTWALQFDPKTWEPKTFSLPVQAAATNRIRFDYDLELNPTEDHFKVLASFAGLPEYEERTACMRLASEEQDRVLLERLARTFNTATFSRAHYQEITTPGRNVTWMTEGSIDRGTGRRRVVDPFPANPWPMGIPDRLDDSRDEKIVLPYAFSYQATCRFTIPRGYVLADMEPIQESNLFGKVSWSLERQPTGDGELCKVVVQVDVLKPVGLATQYPALKMFLGWEREALQRTLVLERR